MRSCALEVDWNGAIWHEVKPVNEFWEDIMKASDSFAIILILIALSYAVSMFVAN